MSSHPPPSDLPAEIFLLLRRAFFAADTSPLPCPLRDKGSTQDDPFDEYVHRLLQEGSLRARYARRRPANSYRRT